MTRALACAALVASIVLPMGAAQAGSAEVDWTTTPPLSGRVVGEEVMVTAGPAGGTFPLVVIDHPAVESSGYSVTGSIRYQAVEGMGYLEMWSVLPDGSRYFTRTLAESGPMGALTGTSEGRGVELPFHLSRSATPVQLEINLVLPGAGTVWVAPLKVGPLDAAAGWWSGPQAGLVGGILGCLIGVLGAVIGWTVSRHRARRLTLGVMWAAVVAGFLSLLLGIVAVAAGQPYAVYFPLLLIGGILTGVFGANLKKARTTYAEAELRKMRAMDSV